MKLIKRRKFLSWLGFVSAGAAFTSISRAGASEQADKSLLLQESPVAGFQFHRGKESWDLMTEGDRLKLIPEPGNKYDDRAIAIYWQDNKLGYLPRRDNAAVSQLLHRRQNVTASIAKLKQSSDPWERIKMEIWLGA